MIKNVYSVRDCKSGFGPLMLQDNDAVAMRAFSVTVRQADSLMHWCAPDYALYCVGSFDDDTGLFHSLEVPKHICDAVTCLYSEE
jgi:hypothetical protein